MRSSRPLVSVLAAVSVMLATPGTGMAAVVAPSGGSGAGHPTRGPMPAHFLPPMPTPASGTGAFHAMSPPRGTKSKPPAAPISSVAAPTQGWTTFSHWQRGDNGTVHAQLYPQPQFRFASGSWKPIDPTVTADTGAPTATAPGMLRPVHFGANAAHLLQIELDHGPVILSAPTLAVGDPTVSRSGVHYSAVARDTDVAYRVSSSGVKERIVLRSAHAPTSFTFHLADPQHQLGSLVDGHDGSYRFSTVIDGDVRMQLPPAYAYEQPPTGVPPALVAGSAHQSVTARGDGYDITETVDPHWLAGKSFPIVLDPTVSFTDSNGTMYAGFSDTSGDSRDPCYNGDCTLNSTDADLEVGSYDLGPPPPYQFLDTRDLFKFDVSSIPTGSSIQSASMNLYVTGCLGQPNGQNSSTYQCNTTWTTPSNAYTVDLDQVTQASGDVGRGPGGVGLADRLDPDCERVSLV